MLFLQESRPRYPNMIITNKKRGAKQAAAVWWRQRGRWYLCAFFCSYSNLLIFKQRLRRIQIKRLISSESFSVDTSSFMGQTEPISWIWISLWAVSVFMLWVAPMMPILPLPVCKIPSSSSYHSAIMVLLRSRPQLPLSDSVCLFLSASLWWRKKKSGDKRVFGDIFNI